MALKNPKYNANFGFSLEELLSSENAGEGLLNDSSTVETSLVHTLEVEEEEEMTKYLIKKADLPGGIARLYLDVAEYFSQKEINKMIRITKSQLGIDIMSSNH